MCVFFFICVFIFFCLRFLFLICVFFFLFAFPFFSLRFLFCLCLSLVGHRNERINKLISERKLGRLVKTRDKLECKVMHYLFREANSLQRAQLEENCELRGTDNVQGQISEHILAPNRGYCVYNPSTLFPSARSLFRPIAREGKYLMDYKVSHEELLTNQNVQFLYSPLEPASGNYTQVAYPAQIFSPLSRARQKLVEVVSSFAQFHVDRNFISITTFMLISVSSLILVTDKPLKLFHFCVLLLQCGDFNCGFRIVLSQSQ